MKIPRDIKQWRRAQRSELLARRAAVSETQYRQWNDAITELLLEGFPALRRMAVGFYWPYRGEVDPRFAIHRLRECGTRAALPVVLESNAPLQFREWWPGVSTTQGVLNLPIPDGTKVVVPEALLIPPVGFDSQGYRLGYGGGYFDRTLAVMNPSPLKIGLAFELSRIPTIHPQSHDVPMDFIVTEAGIHCVNEGGLERIDHACQASDFASALIRARGLPLVDEQGERYVRGYASPPCYAHELDPAYWDA